MVSPVLAALHRAILNPRERGSASYEPPANRCRCDSCARIRAGPSWPDINASPPPIDRPKGAHLDRHGLSWPRPRSPREAVPAFGTTKPRAKALRLAELILSLSETATLSTVRVVPSRIGSNRSPSRVKAWGNEGVLGAKTVDARWAGRRAGGQRLGRRAVG